MSLDSGIQKLSEIRNGIKNIPARERLKKLMDEGSFVELDAMSTADGNPVGVIIGYGTVEGAPVYAFAQDSTVNDGAMNRAHGAKIKKVYDFALKTGSPIVGIYDSNGANLSDANDAMKAYGEMMLWTNNLSGVVPQISLILGPCVGNASVIAAEADFVVAVKDAKFYLSPKEATTAESLAEAGMAHIVAKDEDEAIKEVKTLLNMLPLNNLALAPVTDAYEPATADYKAESVKSLVDADSFVELQAGYGENVVCGLAKLAGNTVGIVNINGEIKCKDVNKATRLVRFCDAFSLPVVTLLNSNGFNNIKSASKLSHAYAEATSPKVTVVTGNAIGAAFVAVAGRAANADVVFAWPESTISALNPETAVELFMEDELKAMKNPLTDRAKLVEQYASEKANPILAAVEGSIDDVIMPDETRTRVISALDILAGKRVTTLPKKHSNIIL